MSRLYGYPDRFQEIVTGKGNGGTEVRKGIKVA